MWYFCAMKLQEWINLVLDEGFVCERYKEALMQNLSKAKLLDIVLDPNGYAFIMDMGNKGYPLPYETIMTDLRSYINGKYIAKKKDKSYTTSAYCCCSDSAYITTTLTLFFGCMMDVYIPQNTIASLYCDTNTHLRIHCPSSSSCVVEIWGYGDIENVNNANITIKHHDNGNT